MGGRPGPRKGLPAPRPRPTGESGLLYGPEGRIRLPKEGTGMWSGTPGDSEWTPENAGNYGLRPGQSIRRHEGVPCPRACDTTATGWGRRADAGSAGSAA